MIFLTDNEIKFERWNNLLDENLFSTPFQSLQYYNFINSVPGQYARVFAIEINDKLQALCVVTIQKEKGLLGYFSRRAIVYGGPLIAGTDFGKFALNELFRNINQHLKNKVIYAEVRNLVDYSFFKDCFFKNGWIFKPHLNVQIDLRDKSIDEVLKAMKYNRRREIGLSLKAGVTIKEGKNQDEIYSLYLILQNLYNKRVKSPLPSLDYFQTLFLSPLAKVFLVMHNHHIIGGSFCIYFPRLSINTLYYCGIRDYGKNIFPTHMAIMAAIEFGLINKLQMVDLMGAGKPGEEYGVRNYKTEFGGELVEHGRYHKIYNHLLFSIGSLGLEILNRFKK